MLTGPCTVASLPGEHLFQGSALPRNRMRPAIFHAFGKAKVGAQHALQELEQQGWETLPIALLGMPNLPPAWVIETWKPGGAEILNPNRVQKDLLQTKPPKKQSSNSRA